MSQSNGMVRLAREEIQKAVQAALAEDVGSGDVTTLSTVPEGAGARGLMIAREPLTVAGVEFAVEAFKALSQGLEIKKEAEDGQRRTRGETILGVSGAARAILTAERVA